ncbi:acyl-CoA N-acyltransferase [Myriangium duriaei CBS 260.36]|uniref:Acyl-CoA N-acyltransferase n=1 Tax=Myriangium duriaei CBS 260.36 TaxID=1168546 RepID=A0A9P4MED5_9PEZI|nr:acyl-CoA N-acyltransferase [Myriangium duriaei CBS 260.36]
MPNTVWASDRLLYRAVENDDDDFIQNLLWADSDTFTTGVGMIPTPPSKKDAGEEREWLQKNLMGAIICLPPSTTAPSTTDNTPPTTDDTTPAAAALANPATSKPNPTPIGFITLSDDGPRCLHHRDATIAISVAKDYQNKGYGSEAILWALEWAFWHANLHRVSIGAFGYNARAIHVYERLGFKFEGRTREVTWYQGRYWDDVDFGMLEGEWRERYKKVEGAMPVR